MSKSVDDKIINPADREPFSSTIDPDLKKAAKIYIIQEDIATFSDLIDMAIREKINYHPGKSAESEKDIFKK